MMGKISRSIGERKKLLKERNKMIDNILPNFFFIGDTEYQLEVDILIDRLSPQFREWVLKYRKLGDDGEVINEEQPLYHVKNRNIFIAVQELSKILHSDGIIRESKETLKTRNFSFNLN